MHGLCVGRLKPTSHTLVLKALDIWIRLGATKGEFGALGVRDVLGALGMPLGGRNYTPVGLHLHLGHRLGC